MQQLLDDLGFSFTFLDVILTVYLVGYFGGALRDELLASTGASLAT